MSKALLHCITPSSSHALIGILNVVKHKPIENEKQPVEVQDFMKIISE